MAEHMIAGADGVRTFVLDLPATGAETGPPVLCLHGLTRNHRDFEDLFAPLQAAGRRVIAPDVRGRGRSDRDPQPGNYHPGTYVQDVLGVLAALSIPKAVFVGTSMGALITSVMVMFAPHMVAGAVLNDAGPEIDPTGLARIQGYVGTAGPSATWAEAAARVRVIGEVAFPGREDAFWERMTRRMSVETGDGIVFDYDPAISQLTRATPLDAIPDMWPQFQAFAAIPTAVVRGALSDLLAPATVARMAREKPDLVVAEVPNVGHAPLLDEPEAWAAIEAILALTSAGHTNPASA
jgi:pimeloyl-ACP methyl ester carboxylesterase